MQSPRTTQQQAQDKNLRLVFVALPATSDSYPQLIDTAYMDAEGVLRGQYSGKNGAELAAEYKAEGRMKLMRMCDFDKLHDEALRTDPEEITEADYDEALNVLPPMKWHHLLGVESFRMSEFYSGHITTIYAKCQGRYWKFRDDAYMQTADLVAKVHKAMQEQVAA